MKVHILFSNTTYCGLNMATWPEGDVWVGVERTSESTCDSCKAGREREIAVFKKRQRSCEHNDFSVEGTLVTCHDCAKLMPLGDFLKVFTQRVKALEEKIKELEPAPHPPDHERLF